MRRKLFTFAQKRQIARELLNARLESIKKCGYVTVKYVVQEVFRYF